VAIVVPAVGLYEMGEKLYHIFVEELAQIRLYSNDPALGQETVLSDFEYDELPPGDTVRGFSANSFTVDVTDGVTTVEWPTQVLTLTGPGVVVGYVLTDEEEGGAYWCERFDPPHVFGSLGGTITITPRLTLGGCNC
jgi:hypothetical protein